MKDAERGRRVYRAHCDVPLCEPRNCSVFTTYEEADHADYTEVDAKTMSFRCVFWTGDMAASAARARTQLCVNIFESVFLNFCTSVLSVG